MEDFERESPTASSSRDPAPANGSPRRSEQEDAGTVILVVTSLAILGGLASVLTIVVGGSFATAVSRSPLYLTFCFLAATQGAVAWSGVAPTYWKFRTVWRATSRKECTRICFALSVVCAAMAGYIQMFSNAFPLDVNGWGLGETWKWRFGIADVLVLFPTLFAVLTMWLSTVTADCRATQKQSSTQRIDAYLEERKSLQDSLWFVGTVLGAVLLTNGMLREAMIDGEFVANDAFPSVLVATNGGFFTLCIVVCYAPAHGLLQRLGHRLREEMLQEGTGVRPKYNERKRLSALLGLNQRFDQSLKNGVAILGPIIGALASKALPHFVK